MVNETHEYCYLPPGRNCCIRATCKYGFMPNTTTRVLFTPEWPGENCGQYEYNAHFGHGKDTVEND